MTIDTATWILAALSLTGTVLNIRKHRGGFLFWTLANTGWIYVNVQKHCLSY